MALRAAIVPNVTIWATWSAPYLAVDIVNDFLPPLVAEIHIEIGHTDALRVQETLKDQIVTDGVDIRNADAVCGNTARAGTTARAYRDALALGVVDVIPDDEVVIGIAHRFDDANFIAQAVLVGLRDIGAVTALQALPAELFKKILVVHSTRGLIIRRSWCGQNQTQNCTDRR